MWAKEQRGRATPLNINTVNYVRAVQTFLWKKLAVRGKMLHCSIGTFKDWLNR